VPPAPRRRLAMAIAVVLGGLALALVAALVLSPALTGLVDGLRALGGAGVDTADEVVERRDEQVPADAQTAVVERVVDGDTIRVTVEEPGGAIPPTDSVRIRLLNVDAPELDHPERGEDCGATEATAFVEALTPPGSTVHLAADVEDRDAYDRPLRGVWNQHGVFVNAELVRAGWAEVVLFPPNDRFHGRLLPLEAQARAEGRGVWAVCDGFPP
jgi:micrococcal nuclease